MIIVSGATGRLGSQVVERLLTRVPAERVGVCVRDPAKAAALAVRGVRVRAANAGDPAALRHAFAGADVVLVISAPLLGSAAIAANRAAIDAAWAAGARRVVYTSHQAAAHDSLFLPQPSHAATQDYLLAGGRPFTALRNGFYAATIGFFVPEALRTGRLALPADGPVSWTAHGDLAEAAVAALLEDPLLDGITPALTATEVLDFAQVAELLGDLRGARVDRVVVEDEQWRRTVVGNGVPEQVADIQLSMFRAARAGEFAVTDPTLTTVLGHPTSTVRSMVTRLAESPPGN